MIPINWKVIKDKVSLVKFEPVSFIYVRFQAWGLRKMLGAMKNWGKWPEIDDVRLPDTILGNAAIENL